MDDAGGVGGRQGRCHLDANIEDLSHVKPASSRAVAQTLALDELGGDEERAVVDTDLVDRQDVRVIQARGGVRFLLESTKPVGLVRGITWQHLDGHGTA